MTCDCDWAAPCARLRKGRHATAAATGPSLALRCASKVRPTTATEPSNALRCASKVRPTTATGPSPAFRCAREARHATTTATGLSP